MSDVNRLVGLYEQGFDSKISAPGHILQEKTKCNN